MDTVMWLCYQPGIKRLLLVTQLTHFGKKEENLAGLPEAGVLPQMLKAPSCSPLLPAAEKEPADRRTPHCFQTLDHDQSFALNLEAW